MRYTADNAAPQAPQTAPNFGAAPPSTAEELKAPKILLMGIPGSGKSTALATYLQQGIELFMIATEPNAVDAVIDRCKAQNISIEKFHYAYCQPNPGNWASLGKMIQTINLQSYEAIADMKTGIDKSNANQIGQLIGIFQNFTCAHCKRSFGDIASFDYEKCVALDSLSGLNILSRQCTVGFKPTMHQGEWGTAMNLEESVISMLANGLRCHFVLISHVDREKDELTGALHMTPAALGTKLGPRLGKDFREVVMAKLQDGNYIWSTQEPNAVTKRTALPLSNQLSPTFEPIIRAFRARVKALEEGRPLPPEPESEVVIPGFGRESA